MQWKSCGNGRRVITIWLERCDFFIDLGFLYIFLFWLPTVSCDIHSCPSGPDSGKRCLSSNVFAGFCLLEVMASVASSFLASSRSFFPGFMFDWHFFSFSFATDSWASQSFDFSSFPSVRVVSFSSLSLSFRMTDCSYKIIEVDNLDWNRLNFFLETFDPLV